MQEPNIPEGFTTRRSLFTKSPQYKPTQNRALTCKFHPNNNLHTFCMNPQCMLPMCSSCISIHNEDHQEARTHGNYKNLQQLVAGTVEALEEQAAAVEELCGEYVEDYQQKISGLQVCKENMYKARVKAHEEIDRIFDRFTLDLEEKVNYFTDQLHELYISLEQRIHQLYKNINKQKQDLSLFLKSSQSHSLLSPSSSYTSLSKNPQTKREDLHTFTPSATTFTYVKQADQRQRNETKKQERRILKTLIEYYSHSNGQKQTQKITRLREQVQQLKGYNFDVVADWHKMNKYLNNFCKECIEVKSSAEHQRPKKRKEVNFVSQESPMGSITEMSSGSKEQINQIMRNTRERMNKMQLSSNGTNGHSPKQRMKPIYRAPQLQQQMQQRF